MNLAEIETFLTIVNTKSITKTADLLFLSQPTVSHRLTSLENELGFSLVIRNKGHKQVELTRLQRMSTVQEMLEAKGSSVGIPEKPAERIK